MSTPTFDLEAVPEHDRARVEAMIPDEKYADGYVHRSLDGFEDFEVFDVAVEEKENIILAGPTGSSKTSAFRAYCADRRLPFALVECNQAMDPGVIVGKTAPDGEGNLGWIDGAMTLVARYGGCILLDEINMAHPRVMAAFKALLSVTRLMTLPENNEEILVTSDVLLGAAYNPFYQGTSRLNEALLNQFGLPFDWDYDRVVEEQLVDSVHLLNYAWRTRPLPEIRTPISTNSLMEFEVHVDRFNIGFAISRFVSRFAEGERGPIKRALTAEAANIANDLGADATVMEVSQ